MYFTIFKFESQEFINLKATSNFFFFCENIFDTKYNIFKSFNTFKYYSDVNVSLLYGL